MISNCLIAMMLVSLCAIRVHAAEGNDAPRSAVIAALTKNKVSVGGLSMEPSMGGPAISLGTGLNGAESNNCNDENLALVAQLPELECLFLYKGTFTKAGLSKLAALPKLRQLQIYAPNQVGPEVFAALAELKTLSTLNFGDYLVTDEMLGHMSTIRGLKSLEITKAEKVSPAAMVLFLATVGDMENLLLGGDCIDDEGLKLLGTKKNLKRLMLYSRKITSSAWSAVAGLTKMQWFDVRGTSFDDAGMRALEGMIDLKFLILGKTRITDVGMTSLAGLTKLTDLGLDGTKITDAGMENLKLLTELGNLFVGETPVSAKGLAIVPRKDRMVMMRAGQQPLSPRQFNELAALFPNTQIFDPAGYWTPERVAKAREEL